MNYLDRFRKLLKTHAGWKQHHVETSTWEDDAAEALEILLTEICTVYDPPIRVWSADVINQRLAEVVKRIKEAENG